MVVQERLCESQSIFDPHCRPAQAVTVEKEEKKDTYPCPVYRTQDRGHTYIFTAGLKSKGSAAKWTMAGVAIILDVV